MVRRGLMYVSELQPYDHFIWADEVTRNVMLVDDKFHYRSGLLVCATVDKPNMQFVFFENETGYNYSYAKNSMVYVVPDAGCTPGDLGWDVHCLRCGTAYGIHQGMRCPTGKSRDFMVPNQYSMHALRSEDWFTSELGL